MTLIFYKGQRLLLDGIDIYKRFMSGMTQYRSGNFYEFGKLMGDALTEMVNKSPYIKRPEDENAYEFLEKFFEGLQMKVSDMNLFNRIDGVGAWVLEPMEGTLREFAKKNELNKYVWNKISAFKEGLKVAG